MIRLRGRNSNCILEFLKKDGIIDFDLPEPYALQRLLIVDKNKHLGSVVTLSDCLVLDAQHRASAVLSAYAPISSRIFGCPHLGVWLKLHFMRALILARSLHNTQLWSIQVPTLRRIHHVYMGVLRTVLGDCQFRRCVFSDARGRQKLDQS